MNLYFNTQKLAKILNSDSKIRAEYGARMGNKIKQRLFELAAAESLAEISRVPHRAVMN